MIILYGIIAVIARLAFKESIYNNRSECICHTPVLVLFLSISRVGQMVKENNYYYLCHKVLSLLMFIIVHMREVKGELYE